MYILGISSFSHEASCSLIKDGEIRVILEEERFNREKHTWKFPENAIAKCLEIEGITFDDIDRITFFWKPLREVLGNIAHMIKFFPKSLNLLKVQSCGVELSFFQRIRAKQTIRNRIKKHFGLKKVPKVEFVEHHLAHAASAFFVSPFKEAAILTVDGRGESTSTMLSRGEGNQIHKIKEIKVPNSLGHLYAAVTDYLGFRPFFDEWKVMGMSAYGTPAYVEKFQDVVHFKENGEYELNLKYFGFHTRGQDAWLSDAFFEEFGPKREYEGSYDQRHFDIAFGLQAIVEKAGVHLANYLYEVTQLPNLCMTGGVVLNCLMNKRVVEQTPFKEFFFQPIANDTGTSLGSALYYYHHTLGKERKFVFNTAYWGNEYSNEAIEKVLKEKRVFYTKVDDIASQTAQHIAEGKIVGWFQGRMEAGPRALGNRSITVSPLDAKMKTKLNARVKKREFYRPFAPSVLEERVDEYFDIPKGQKSPYMILIGDVKEDKKEIIPAVTHNDGTARVHTVSKEINPKYWALIHAFEKITGVPVLLNTSFNENEPIVCTPEDAVNCFLRTEFDCLAIGDFLVTK